MPLSLTALPSAVAEEAKLVELALSEAEGTA